MDVENINFSERVKDEGHPRKVFGIDTKILVISDTLGNLLLSLNLALNVLKASFFFI